MSANTPIDWPSGRWAPQQADEERVERRDAAAEIVGKALPRAAHAGREQLGQNGPMPEKIPEAKKPSGKPRNSIIVSSTGICV